MSSDSDLLIYEKHGPHLGGTLHYGHISYRQELVQERIIGVVTAVLRHHPRMVPQLDGPF